MSSPETGGRPLEEIKLSPRDRLVRSGIAERMLKQIKSHKAPYEVFNFGIEDCNFRVERSEGIGTKGRKRRREGGADIIIEMPNPNTRNRGTTPRVIVQFGVLEDGRLGSAVELLTAEQLAVIQEILQEQSPPGESGQS